MRIVRTREYTSRPLPGQVWHKWSNTNLLLGKYPGMLGGKTGTTPESGASLVVVDNTRTGHRLTAVLLGDTQARRFRDMAALLNYARTVVQFESGG